MRPLFLILALSLAIGGCQEPQQVNYDRAGTSLLDLKNGLSCTEELSELLQQETMTGEFMSSTYKTEVKAEISWLLGLGTENSEPDISTFGGGSTSGMLVSYLNMPADQQPSASTVEQKTYIKIRDENRSPQDVASKACERVRGDIELVQYLVSSSNVDNTE